MSLINQVLRDLDQRHAPAAERAALTGLDDIVRPLPPPVSRFHWSKLGWIALGAALGAGILWLALQGTTRLEPAAPPPNSTPAATLPSPPLAIAKPTEKVSVPKAPPAAEPAANLESLQLDDTLTAPSASLAADIAVAPIAKPSPTARATTDKSPKPAKSPAPNPGRNNQDIADQADKEPAHIASRAGKREARTVIEKAPQGEVAAGSQDSGYEAALVAHRQGHTGEALNGFLAVLERAPRHAHARQAALSLLLAEKRWNDAEKVASDGLALGPGHSAWALILARLQVEQKQLASAESTLTQYAAQSAGNADYQAFHALLLQKLGRYKEAIEHYRIATALRPGEGRWWYGLGLALESEQRPGEAQEAFRQARDVGKLPPELIAEIERKLR